MTQKQPGRQGGVRRSGEKRTPTQVLAAAHAALDDLEESLRALPGADHLVDGVLRLRGMVIEAFAFGFPRPRPPRQSSAAHAKAANDRSVE